MGIYVAADKRYSLWDEDVDDVKQVFRGASQTDDALEAESIVLSPIIKHCPEL